MQPAGPELAGPTESPTIAQAGELRSARLESVRAIAALAVLVGHTYGSATNVFAPTHIGYLDRVALGGGFGVFLFFVLSGYLLYWPFAKRDFGAGESIDLRRYAINRALRILPLYYVTVVVVLLVQYGGGARHQWAYFLTFSENFSTRTFGQVDGVLWSLVVELHFYVLLPIIALALAGLSHGSRARAAGILVALGAAAFVLRLETLPPSPHILLHHSLPATFGYFAVGMLLAVLRLQWEETPPAWLRGPLRSRSLWLLASVPLWALLFDHYDWEPLAAAASFLIVAACVLPLGGAGLARVLDWRPLAVVGVASYSLYLWHVPILEELVGSSWAPESFSGLLAVAAPLSIAVALISYKAVESPFLRLRRRWARSSPAPEPARPAPLEKAARPG